MEKPLQDEELTAEDKLRALGGHPILNLLNTVAPRNGKSVDSLKSGNDVLEWLDRAGWPLTKGSSPSLPPRLLKTARALREDIRTLVEKRKAGKRVNLETLNAFLAKSESYLQLLPRQDRILDLHRSWKQNTAEQVLGPLAEVAAELISDGDFSLIRRCENKECVLWFYDRTRSHRRRWCSMATCGNRSKVEAFRDRQWHRSLTGSS
jgi:predicted RNA-binding Zn ribbon-like protein